MRTLVLRPIARADILMTCDYYNNISPIIAAEFSANVSIGIDELLEAPEAFPIYSLKTNTRSRRVKGFSYRIIYGIENDEVVVYGVLHTSIDPAKWARRIPG
jgi:plasmid stabilization system protein ParE